MSTSRRTSIITITSLLAICTLATLAPLVARAQTVSDKRAKDHQIFLGALDAADTGGCQGSCRIFVV